MSEPGLVLSRRDRPALRKSLAVVALTAIIAFLAALGVIKTFVTDTMPWLVQALGGWGAILAAVAAVAAVVVAVVLFFQYHRYRAATRTLMWRYTIDVQDAQAGRPGYGTGQSDAVKSGEASADKARGDRIYRDLLNLPPEDEYR